MASSGRRWAEVPLFALLILVHLGIALPRCVLGRRRRSHEGGIDDGALTQEQAALGQMGVDGLKQRPLERPTCS